jgi:hypothetical protein
LQFEWIAKLLPNRPSGSADDIRFNQARNFMTDQPIKVSFETDSGVLGHPEALVISSISSNVDENTLSSVPSEVQKSTDIMTNKAAQYLPTQKPYDHVIDLLDGDYPL